MMALHYGAYNALVDPLHFVDVIVDPDIQIAIATNKGAIISSLNNPNQALLGSIVALPNKGEYQSELYAISRGDSWMAIAIEPSEGMLPNLRRERTLLLPIGAFIAIFIVGVVIWMSRRRLSPLGELEIAIRNREFIVQY